MKPIRFSPSQHAMYQRCPRQWAFRYVEGLKIPPAGAMKLGSVGAMSFERNYKQKADTFHDLPLDEMEDFTAQTWDDELSREEVAWRPDERPSAFRDTAVAAVRVHHKKIAPQVQPASAAAVEERIVIDFIQSDKGEVGAKVFEGEDFKGREADGLLMTVVSVLDVTDADGVIRDAKIRGRKENAFDLARDPQLTYYALAKRLQTRKAEPRLCHDLVTYSRNSVDAMVVNTKRTKEHLAMHLNDIGHIARAINAESFPRNPTGWWCSKKFCGYWDRCMGKGLTWFDQHEVSNGSTTVQSEVSAAPPTSAANGAGAPAASAGAGTGRRGSGKRRDASDAEQQRD